MAVVIGGATWNKNNRTSPPKDAQPLSVVREQARKTDDYAPEIVIYFRFSSLYFQHFLFPRLPKNRGEREGESSSTLRFTIPRSPQSVGAGQANAQVEVGNL